MPRFYVDITGVPQSRLDLAGYVCIAEDANFKILARKNETYIIDKSKPYLFCDDHDDAQFLGANVTQIIDLPEKPAKKKLKKKRKKK